jgi:hypothetical protein
MEMDIYMRRRLVALGGIVAFFIVVVLLIRSCGGDDEETPAAPLGATGTGAAAPLPKEDFIASADVICSDANAAIATIDPEDPDATQQELELTEQERIGIDSLVLEDPSGKVDKFNAALNDLVDALETKQLAQEASDAEAEAAADEQIAAAKENAQQAAESYGFEECGQFGEPGTSTSGETTGEGESTGETDTGGTTPVAPVPTEPVPVEPVPTEPAPTEPTEPPSDSGGITP